jgi:hypothetical protein
MQFSLFQPEDFPQTPIKSEGAIMREKLRREHNYQQDKKESDDLQRRWARGAESRRAEEDMRMKMKNELDSKAPETIVLVRAFPKKRTRRTKRRIYIFRIGSKKRESLPRRTATDGLF